MKHRPLVSILINNYNYGRFITKAIDSALNQTYPHIEVIVVDDGSTDNSSDIIASFKDQIIPILKENGGQGSAFNVGFAASKGDIICFLDADDIFVPEKVERVVNVFGSSQDTGWCFHRVKLIDANTGAFIRLSQESSSRECDFRSDIRKGKLCFTSPPTSGLCFTRSMLYQILPMPESEASTAADRFVKLSAIALSKGFFLDEQLTIQQVHGSNALTNMGDKQQFSARERTVAAYWLRAKFSELATFTNRYFASGLGTYWRTGGVEDKYKAVVKNYLSTVSPLERFEINLRAFYYCLKL
jgi:glycosyltransferase involved in cell wall biosynthesis